MLQRWRSWGWRWRWGGAHTSTHLFFRMSAVGCLLEPTCACGWLCWRRFVTRVLAPLHVHAFARDGRAGVRRPDIVCACGTGNDAWLATRVAWQAKKQSNVRRGATLRSVKSAPLCATLVTRTALRVVTTSTHRRCQGVRGQSEAVWATVGGTLAMAMRAWEWLNRHTQQLLLEWDPCRALRSVCVRAL